MDQESLRIVLKTYSKGGINEDEAVQLIEDLYKNKINYVPYWPQITWDNTPNIVPKYEITCKHD
jgi:hypothetical protein